ncbi:MAG: hypothetical protein WCX65_02105 [bacterium]
MKKSGRWHYTVLWLLLFVWLNMYPFRGFLFPLSGLQFVLCFALMATFHFEEAAAAAMAVAAGALLDAITGGFIHTLAFAAVFFAAKLLKSMFYRPGSAFHALAYAPLVLIANAALYVGTAGPGFSLSGAPAVYLLEWSGINFALFLAMVLLFKPRGRAVMYKMR